MRRPDVGGFWSHRDLMTGIIDVTVHARVSKWLERRADFIAMGRGGRGKGRSGFFAENFSRGSKVRLIILARPRLTSIARERITMRFVYLRLRRARVSRIRIRFRTLSRFPLARKEEYDWPLALVGHDR